MIVYVLLLCDLTGKKKILLPSLKQENFQLKTEIGAKKMNIELVRTQEDTII